MAQNSTMRNWLAENPKMMGALWALLLLLAEMGNAAAGGTITGP